MTKEEREKAEQDINNFYSNRLDYLTQEVNKSLDFNNWLFSDYWQSLYAGLNYQIKDSGDWQLNFEDTILGSIMGDYDNISSYTEQIKIQASGLAEALQTEWETFNSNI
jgi:hypothetical protein